MNDFARAFYWGYVLCPFVGIIGISSFKPYGSKMKCHIALCSVMVFIALVPIMCGFPILHFNLWNDDGLTRFSRMLVGLGAFLTSWTQRILFPKFYTEADVTQTSTMFLLIYLLFAVAILSVSTSSPSLTIIFIVFIMVLLMAGSLYRSSSERFNSTWNVFRIVFCILILILLNLVFHYHLPSKLMFPIMNESGYISILGITFVIGIFPLSLVYDDLIEKLPTFLAGVYTFIIPVPVFVLYIRLLNLYPTMRHPEFIVLLCLISIAYSVIGEYVSNKNTPVKSASTLTGCIVLSIMLQTQVGLYIACLFLMSLVVYAPLSVMVDRNSDIIHKDSVGWLYLALSGLPPVGIFWACFLLIFYWSQQTYILAFVLFLLLMARGSLCFDKIRISFVGLKVKEVKLVLCCLILQTIILPLGFSDWIFNLFKFSLISRGSG